MNKMHYVVGTDNCGGNHEFIVVASSEEEAIKRIKIEIYSVDWYSVQVTPVPADTEGHRIMVLFA